MSVPQAQTLQIGLGPAEVLPNGGELVFDASKNIPAGSAAAYQWTGDNGFNATTPAITVSEPRVYFLAVTNLAGFVFYAPLHLTPHGKQHVSLPPLPSLGRKFYLHLSPPR